MANGQDDASSAFHIRIASTGERFEVPPEKSVLFALIERGYKVPSSCSDGRCGTCKVRYLEGEPDHRDQVLSAEERGEYLTVCVSRARSGELVLDLPDPRAAEAPSDPYAVDRPIAIVDQGICVACLTCVRACTFGAARIDAERVGVGGIMGAAVVDMDECTGCGLCAAACPTGAISMTRFTEAGIAARVDEAAHVPAADGARPRLVAFCCPNSTPSAQGAQSDAAELEIVEMPCTGRVDNLHVMRAFEDGADGVLVAGCLPGQCLFKAGNTNAEKRVRRIQSWLDDVGLEAARARMVHVPDQGRTEFTAALTALTAEVQALGPSPVRLAAAKPEVRAESLGRQSS